MVTLIYNNDFENNLNCTFIFEPKKKKKKHPLAKDQTQIAKQFLETITRQRKIFCQSPKACNHLMYCVYNSGECIHSSIWTVVN